MGDHGCLLAKLSKDFTNEIQEWASNSIMPTHMVEQEFETHVTVLYGFNDNPPQEVVDYCQQSVPRFIIELGNVSLFQNPEFDVLKIEVTSKELNDIHYDLRDQFNPTITHNDYKPHITIAYLESGTGNNYTTDEFVGRKFRINKLTYSDKHKNQTEFELI